MNLRTHRVRFGFTALGLLAGLLSARADDRVILVATASEEYSRRRVDESGQPRVESYVLMEGKIHGGIGSDRSAETMSFRRIAELLAPELARQHYLPTRDAAAADLLLVVHRGTTVPRITTDQMRGVTGLDLDRKEDRAAENKSATGVTVGTDAFLSAALSDVDLRIAMEMLEKENDQAGDGGRRNTNGQLLGYHQQLTRMKHSITSSPQESALRLDMESERYFLIIRAYDLKKKRKLPAGAAGEPVWVLYVNMSSAGQDFVTAISQMSVAAKDYFGRSTDGFQTIRPGKGNVRLAPLELKDDAPANAVQPASASQPK